MMIFHLCLHITHVIFLSAGKARGRLEGNSVALLKGPLAPDPVMYPGCYSAQVTPRPRIGANAADILERGRRGVMGNLLKLEGVSLIPNPSKPSKIHYESYIMTAYV